MTSIKCLALQLAGAKSKKEEIEKTIRRLNRELLDTKEASAMLAPIHNEGGERTVRGITVEMKRDHIWDQAILDEVSEAIPKQNWPSFLTQQTTYKVDMRAFKDYALAHPELASKWHDAHSIKLGDPRVKSINAEKLLKEED
jgi:23S rRNA G2445 N2-methylase RlmL